MGPDEIELSPRNGIIIPVPTFKTDRSFNSLKYAFDDTPRQNGVPVPPLCTSIHEGRSFVLPVFLEPSNIETNYVYVGPT